MRPRGDKNRFGSDAAKHNVEQKLQPVLAAGLGKFGSELIGGKRAGDGGIGTLVVGREPDIRRLAGSKQGRRKHMTEAQAAAASEVRRP